MKVWKILLSSIFTMLLAVNMAFAVQIGPAPTSTMLNGDGTFAVSSSSVSSLACGTGCAGGTVYYPTTAGQYGVIAVCPGFTGTSSSISWFARRLATYGFVTIAMDANSTDQRIGRYGVAFAKRFVDGDTRYNEFLCGASHTAYATSSRFDTYLSTCPY